ncbi:HpcH/HpaI aldolase/citrate lyase family protein [Sodiomyces alkalinus F11]|uniref:HpcH/HpaI aldolase/citrate lyase family protein n=1 Tax=Sodiomyces alkalinus (strain CBS 110278 / VKM F-3762 / F11) TaxID=1314773 RepID=A0A3N2PT03_SODAK|nr:HpcH/HpaI aldolase/citrate lyase family protein [Sodiomyces alkalinus F11]ROT37637.1 HpcH/HpaI aldolase/citrate lyase family protein [Sodiomyces alkalinus F11]
MQRFQAETLFQPSNLVAAIQEANQVDSDGNRKPLFGSIMAFPHQKVARTVAVLGLDFVMIDALHTAIDAENLYALIQTINFVSQGRTCAVVRVPSAESHLLAYALDAGASGIIFPHVDTAAEAAAAVKKVRYEYSGGERSLSPCALLNGITDMAPPGWSAERIADRNIAVICQIESAVAVENVDEIARIPGVHSLMLGAGDLRVSLGLPSRTPPGTPEDPRFFAAVEKLIAAANAHDKALMTVAFKTNANDAGWLRNFSLVLTSADIVSVVKGHKEDLARTRELLKNARSDKKVVVKTRANGHANGMVNGHSKEKLNGSHAEDEKPNGQVNGDL